MKNITITLDLKSLCVGALGVFAIMSLSNFNKPDTQQQDTTDEVRRYNAIMNEKGAFIILDTKTGRYLIDNSYTLRPRWLKGDFNGTHADPSTKTD